MITMHSTAEVPATLFSSEAEQALLGGLLLAPNAAGVVERLGGNDLFYDPLHAAIFNVICEKNRADELADMRTVGLAMANHSGLSELAGGKYLIRLVDASVGPAAIKGYAEVLAELAQKRQIHTAISAATAELRCGDVKAADVTAQLESTLMSINQIGDSGRPISMLRACKMLLDQAAAAYQAEDLDRVKSGISTLDSILPGFFPGELTLLGGRPAMGKSAIALSIALNVARAGHGVVIVSLEMTPEAIAARAVSEATANAGQPVAYTAMRRGDMSEEQFREVADKANMIGSLPITFLARDCSNIGSMLSGIRQIGRSGNLKLLIVDYAQLMTAPGNSRYEQITAISLALKGMAVSLNIPVIALSQLSRQIENRDDKRPVMSDLRESGQLEQDADNILFCYRPEYYIEMRAPASDASVDEICKWTAEMEATRGKLEIIVAKQRMGETGIARCRCALATNSVWGEPRATKQ